MSEPYVPAVDAIIDEVLRRFDALTPLSPEANAAAQREFDRSVLALLRLVVSERIRSTSQLATVEEQLTQLYPGEVESKRRELICDFLDWRLIEKRPKLGELS